MKKTILSITAVALMCFGFVSDVFANWKLEEIRDDFDYLEKCFITGYAASDPFSVHIYQSNSGRFHLEFHVTTKNLLHFRKMNRTTNIKFDAYPPVEIRSRIVANSKPARSKTFAVRNKNDTLNLLNKMEMYNEMVVWYYEYINKSKETKTNISLEGFSKAYKEYKEKC